MDIVKVSIMGICGMMLGFILKETRPEFAALVTMMTGFLILGLAAGKVSYLFETMNRLRESFPIAVISQFWLRLSGSHISDSFHLQSAKMPDIR